MGGSMRASAGCCGSGVSLVQAAVSGVCGSNALMGVRGCSSMAMAELPLKNEQELAYFRSARFFASVGEAKIRDSEEEVDLDSSWSELHLDMEKEGRRDAAGPLGCTMT